jgi:hypothetical protein
MIHTWNGPYSVQTDEPLLIRQLYRLLYNETYHPLARGEVVVFRPKAQAVEEVQAIVLGFKTDAQKAL